MDFVQISPQLFRTQKGEIYPPLQGSSTDDAGFFIDLSRYDEDRTPVHARYRCEHGALNLRLEPINGKPTVAGMPVHSLLQSVEECSVAYLGADNTWFSAWPGEQAALKPRAIRIRLTLAGRGQFERLYYLP
ncbi:type II secretion system protein GspJ [Propionivibrio sp.]|uniref:type II secretion system protein GspJ n=1 Tax=Propionivibrio sp. TaxID=2212460 RepID=UPI003BF31AEB